MKLNPGERSILSYFPNRIKAQNTADELMKSGFKEVQIDRVSKYGVTHNNEINNPIAGRAETGTGLTLFEANEGAFANNDARVLMGADPSNSGYGHIDYGEIGGKGFLVTIVTTEEKVEPAVKIIKENGGQV